MTMQEPRGKIVKQESNHAYFRGCTTKIASFKEIPQDFDRQERLRICCETRHEESHVALHRYRHDELQAGGWLAARCIVGNWIRKGM